MIKPMAFFLAGSLATGGLFQLNLGLPSFHTAQYEAQDARVNEAKKQIKDRRNKLSSKTLKKAGKKAAGALIPFVGAAITVGLAAQDYCDDVEGLISLSNTLSGIDEEFSYQTCVDEAKAEIEKLVPFKGDSEDTQG